MQWNKSFRGGDSIYGESIYTNRYEAIGKYDLPIREKISFNFSITYHHQNSYYGFNKFFAQQNIAFGQFLWRKDLSTNHQILIGAPLRYTFYDDNTVGTDQPQKTFLPGVFVQDEIKHSNSLTSLVGLRYDYNTEHGSIFSPRLSFKYKLAEHQTLRLGGGNGYRVVNLFTEDHAALTGSRTVVIEERLKPEQSYNINLNYTGFVNHSLGFIGIDASLFYTYFTNKIIGDFLTSPDSILYTNLKGHAISKGISANLDFQFNFPLKVMIGGTYMNVYSVQDNVIVPQLHAPKLSGNFAITYSISPLKLTIDYTGRVMSPMHLPTIENDFRPSKSPWFSIQNIQLTKKFGESFELYGGAKNLLNFVPKNPISRPFDPFEKTLNSNQGTSDPNIPANQNIGFDTAYNYAPLLGTYAFLGFRYTLK
jgi:outer membrane receptor for ferrienterochelin and colicins